jgi:CHAT domain
MVSEELCFSILKFIASKRVTFTERAGDGSVTRSSTDEHSAREPDIFEQLVPDYSFDDISDAIRWLNMRGYIGKTYPAGIMGLYYYSLSEKGIEVVRTGKFEQTEKTLFSAMTKKNVPATTILFLAADPTDESRLRLGEELREIQEKLQLAKLRKRFRLEQRMSVRPADVTQALLDVQPEIVHFSGHGTTSGELCFENQVGESHPVQPEALAALFQQFAHQVKCVLLNVCHSDAQAKAIAEQIPHVIGMNDAISDDGAIAFAIGFYQALGAGSTIDTAYELGCVQIRLMNIPEHLIPKLFKKT